MFRGIDPEGLLALAGVVEQKTHSTKSTTSTALNLLGRRGRITEANTLGAAVGRAEQWSLETAANLRWRADAIRTGQEAGLNILSLLHAEFAAEAVFSIQNVDAAYADWIRQMETSWQRVDTAVANISSWLHQGWTDFDVTNTDLQNIQTTLKDLTGDELDRVIAALSPAQLERWIAEMGYRFNGFSQDEKLEVFAMLAGNVSGEALGKLHDAILRSGAREDVVDFGAAMQMISADQIIVDFVAYAMSQGLANHRYRALAPVLAIAGVDDDQTLNDAVGAIATREGALQLLVVDAFVADATHEGDVSTSLLSVLTRTTDVETRTAVFMTLTSLAAMPQQALTSLITERISHQTTSGSQTTLQLAESIRTGALDTATALIEHDPNAVIQELATTTDPAGSIATDYWALLVSDGQSGTIGRILDRLRGGDIVQADAFSNVGVDPGYRFPHARNLAYTAATLNAALSRHAAEAKGTIDNIVRFATIATAIGGVITSIENLGGLLVGSGAETGVVGHSGNTKDGIDEQLAALRDQVTTALRPAESIEQTQPIVAGALDAWSEVYLRLTPSM